MSEWRSATQDPGRQVSSALLLVLPVPPSVAACVALTFPSGILDFLAIKASASLKCHSSIS